MADREEIIQLVKDRLGFKELPEEDRGRYRSSRSAMV